MVGQDRQETDAKPFTRAKISGDMDPWFPPSHSPSRKTDVFQVENEHGDSAFGETHSILSSGESDLMFNFGRFVARVCGRLRQLSRMQLLFFGYLLFSFYAFNYAVSEPGTLRSIYSRASEPTILANVSRLSPLQDLSPEFLMSKLTSLYPPPVALVPYATSANTDPVSVTACLWTQDVDLDILPTWASRWKGPISIVITTFHAPNTFKTQRLFEEIEALRKASSTKHHQISAHVVHLEPGTPENPNAFLNLARVFAQTPNVALFPGNLTFVPPKSFQRSISSSSPSSLRKPVVFTVHGQTVYPFTALSPVLLARDNAVWCTERFFPTLSRSAEWTECLWQLWLENYGDVEARLTTDWLDGLQPSHNASSIEAKVHRRLRAKFRTETCTLATRQTAATRSVEHGVDMKKLRWLKRHCRPWIAGRERD